MPILFILLLIKLPEERGELVNFIQPLIIHTNRSEKSHREVKMNNQKNFYNQPCNEFRYHLVPVLFPQMTQGPPARKMVVHRGQDQGLSTCWETH